MMDAHAVHATLGANGWRNVLLAAGIDEKLLKPKSKNNPCPACGGTDRFTFDNRHGRGDFYCRQCGPGDGFMLLMRIRGMSFKDAFQYVLELAGIKERSDIASVRVSPIAEPAEPAKPTRRVVALLRESCAVEDCDAARAYVASRMLWPLPQGHGLRAHPSVEYWQEGKSIGRFPALLAAVRDIGGELVTVHVTYLDPEGNKLAGYEPRKLLSALTGRDGCAVPLMRLDGDVLGIAEGIETALSAAFMHTLPVWAALNTSLLQKFEPPEQINKLVIFADRDVAGLDAATKLMERLQEKVRLEIRTPQLKDFNDVLRSHA